jgi:GNAT superfamily N-acetyltransferase
MSLIIRPIAPTDMEQWRPLWDGYNAFYGRSGPTALAEEITAATWRRFFDGYEPINALVAELDGRLVGLAHYIFHRNTTRLGPNCYLNDLFTDDTVRGQGIGKALIEAVSEQAKAGGSLGLWWLTHETNHTAMRLYDHVAVKSGMVQYLR